MTPGRVISAALLVVPSAPNVLKLRYYTKELAAVTHQAVTPGPVGALLVPQWIQRPTLGP